MYTHVHVTYTDINECDTDSDDCGDNSICANTIGSFTCTCETGYQGSSGRKCVGKTFVYDANFRYGTVLCANCLKQRTAFFFINIENFISKFVFTKVKAIYYQAYLMTRPHFNMPYQS